MYRTDFWTLWEKARVECLKRTALQHVYNLGWNRSPAQVGCMRQVLRPGALGRPRGIAWKGRQEGGSGWGTHVTPRLIHVNVWQKPLQYCKVISLQLIKKRRRRTSTEWRSEGEGREQEEKLWERQFSCAFLSILLLSLLPPLPVLPCSALHPSSSSSPFSTSVFSSSPLPPWDETHRWAIRKHWERT